MIKLGIIGAGAMGKAIAEGLDATGIYAASEIMLYDINHEGLKQIKKFQTTDSINKLCSNLCDESILLFAIKPQNLDDVLKEIKKLNPNTTIVSILAGTKIAKFENKFPDNPIIRAMPNTPAQIAKGASALAPNSLCSEENLSKVLKIFSSIGLAIHVNENQLDAVTALSGSGPAYLFYLVEAMTEAGVKLGLDLDSSKSLARQTIYGAASLMISSGKEASELRAQVTSPNGTTEAAITNLGKNNFKDIVNQAMEAACQRSKDLAENKS